MKMYALLISLLIAITAGQTYATGDNTSNEDNRTLFEFGPYKVPVSEFIEVYTKNNVTSSGDFRDSSVRDYLNLYVKFKLKVQEAKDMRLDTSASVQKEFETYRKQLAQSYLIDKQITDKLLKETYDRLQKEVHAKHILVKLDENAAPALEEEALNKIKAIKKRIDAGEDFEKVATETSDDPSAKKNGGDLGYFTALQMVYPFESAAYNTPVGKTSDPVRTKFGYHLVKVEDMRPALGEIHSAHIFIKAPSTATEEQKKAAKQKIDDLYKKLQAGEDFEKLAREMSDDKSTASKGGELPWFGAGRMVKEFEDAAFALKKDGDFSDPVMSQYGWHIIKRIEKKELQSFDEMKSSLRRKVEKDSRSQITKKEFVEKLKTEYAFKEYAKNKAKLLALVDESVLKGEWKFENPDKLKKPLFTLDGKNYLQKDYATYLLLNQPKKSSSTKEEVFNSLYDRFVEKTITEYEESRLEAKYPEFKKLMGEYRDGILLFELIDQKVWSKAVKDTIGLKEFYTANKDKYMWKDRVEATIYKCESKEVAKQARKLLAKKLSDDELLENINGKENPSKKLTIEMAKKYERGQNSTVDQATWKEGISNDINENNGSVSIVKIISVLKPQNKTLEEARGYVISDYQDYLENKWVESLKQKYPVKIEEAVLKTIIKE